MKKLALLMGFMLCSIFAFSQRYAVTVAQDSLVNADTTYYEVPVEMLSPGQYTYLCNVTKESGTVAGDVYYQVATRGSDVWYTVGTDTLADQALNTIVHEDRLYADKFRVMWISSGTMKAYLRSAFAYKGD